MKRKTAWKALSVWAVLSCIIILLLYSLWGYLNTSATFQSFSRELVLQHQTQPPSTDVSATSYLGYTANVFISQGNSLAYYLYIPAHYNPARKYPLVLLLHGGGER